MQAQVIDIYRGKDPRDLPAYGIAEASYFLRVSKATVSRWSRYVIVPAGRRPTVLSFFNLVELHVLKAMRFEHEISLPKIREAMAFTEGRLEVARPLVHQAFQTDGVDLFVDYCGRLVNANKAGQTALRKVIVSLLRRVEWDQAGLARQLALYSRSPDEPIAVTANPLVKFGRPCLKGTRLPVDLIAGLRRAGDSEAEIAEVYQLSLKQVQSALAWEPALEAA